MRKHAHGAIALKSVLDFFDVVGLPPLDSFVKLCFARYRAEGWIVDSPSNTNVTNAKKNAANQIHVADGLVKMAKEYGLSAASFDWSMKKVNLAFMDLGRVVKETPCITWLYQQPIVVTSTTISWVNYNDPAIPDRCDVRQRLAPANFVLHWSRRGVIIKN
jgi:hypothetical protein